jgi:hypothetical protein
MNQALYAHMNNKRKRKKKIKFPIICSEKSQNKHNLYPKYIICVIWLFKVFEVFRTGGMAQVVDLLPNRCEVLNSNLSTANFFSTFNQHIIIIHVCEAHCNI